MEIKAWTDYPFHVLGDERFGEIRECRIVAWDRDKYVRIVIDGMAFMIKRWYCYTAPGRFEEVPQVPKAELDKLSPMWYKDIAN